MAASSWPDGVVPIPGANAVFLEPSLIISSAYSHFTLLPSLYYSRSSNASPQPSTHNICNPKKKRKRKAYSPNLKEQRAEQRHLEIRQLILNAHTAFMVLLEVRSLLTSIEDSVLKCKRLRGVQGLCVELPRKGTSELIDLVELGSVWQAPLYTFSLLSVNGQMNSVEARSCESKEHLSTSPLFNHMIANEHNVEVFGICADTEFLLPKRSRVLISDFTHIRQLIPSDKRNGYNIVLIDPPWENKSVHRQALYPTLPNRYLLSLPLPKLVHTDGALVALWVTNREKLRSFVENELFPAWGISKILTWYWLKIKTNGEMISELDLRHHKPYECLFLGYIPPQTIRTDTGRDSSQASLCEEILAPKVPPDKQVLISIPGDHSRKPPLGLLLSRYSPGHAPVKGLELFARDLSPDWTSWGNEPLNFQHLCYFRRKVYP